MSDKKYVTTTVSTSGDSIEMYVLKNGSEEIPAKLNRILANLLIPQVTSDATLKAIESFISEGLVKGFSAFGKDSDTFTVFAFNYKTGKYDSVREVTRGNLVTMMTEIPKLAALKASLKGIVKETGKLTIHPRGEKKNASAGESLDESILA